MAAVPISPLPRRRVPTHSRSATPSPLHSYSFSSRSVSQGHRNVTINPSSDEYSPLRRHRPAVPIAQQSFRPVDFQTAVELDQFFGQTKYQKRQLALHTKDEEGRWWFDTIERDENQSLLRTRSSMGSLSDPYDASPSPLPFDRRRSSVLDRRRSSAFAVECGRPLDPLTFGCRGSSAFLEFGLSSPTVFEYARSSPAARDIALASPILEEPRSYSPTATTRDEEEPKEPCNIGRRQKRKSINVVGDSLPRFDLDIFEPSASAQAQNKIQMPSLLPHPHRLVAQEELDAVFVPARVGKRHKDLAPASTEREIKTPKKHRPARLDLTPLSNRRTTVRARPETDEEDNDCDDIDLGLASPRQTPLSGQSRQRWSTSLQSPTPSLANIVVSAFDALCRSLSGSSTNSPDLSMTPSPSANEASAAWADQQRRHRRVSNARLRSQRSILSLGTSSPLPRSANKISSTSPSSSSRLTRARSLSVALGATVEGRSHNKTSNLFSDLPLPTSSVSPDVRAIRRQVSFGHPLKHGGGRDYDSSDSEGEYDVFRTRRIGPSASSRVPISQSQPQPQSLSLSMASTHPLLRDCSQTSSKAASILGATPSNLHLLAPAGLPTGLHVYDGIEIGCPSVRLGSDDEGDDDGAGGGRATAKGRARAMRRGGGHNGSGSGSGSGSASPGGRGRRWFLGRSRKKNSVSTAASGRKGRTKSSQQQQQQQQQQLKV